MTTVDQVSKRFASASVTEPRTYTRQSDPMGNLFLQDVVRGTLLNDRNAKERLGRHQMEERDANPNMVMRSSSGEGTSAFSGLVVPAYLAADLVALSIQNGRPLADAMNSQPLPDTGASVNLTRITTGTSAAQQTSELGTVSITDPDDTLLVLPLKTVAGETIVSRQLFDRAPAAASVIFQELSVAYNASLDSMLINEATTGLSAVAQNISYTDASPTPAELYPILVKAAAASQGAVKGRGRPDLVVMNSNRWYWLQEVLASSWPIFGSMDPRNAGRDYGSGWVGCLPMGLNVILDDSITTSGTAGGGTGEDEIYVGPSREGLLFENPDGPLMIKADQMTAGNVGMTLVLYGYVSYTFGRMTNAFQKVTGTGLEAVTL